MDGPHEPNKSAEYQVVARRYRPKTFDELIGQGHVAGALANAITSNRVGHAYLFTGARGVGKTSSARIFAKALNCETGPTATPCNECDICQAIAAGEDVDVLEIDGASNRGIDEIRQLRQSAGIRPSRAHYKIYIIDEVHMLTREAFNALLKTLEEPPEHVKFFFCTTEPSKIPITILSRCQRFDFAGIESSSIQDRLRQIGTEEGVEVDDEALRILARRAAGSMRDAQSLLEQLLANTTGRIAASDVHAMLGTADCDRLRSLAAHLIQRDAAAALGELEHSLRQGVDVGLLVEELFGYLRDLMVVHVGCPGDLMLFASAGEVEPLRDAAKSWGLETILAAMQILEQTLSRMRYSTQGRLLAELALVRICHLEQLEEISLLARQLLEGGSTPPTPAAGRPAPPPSPAPKKNVPEQAPRPVSPSPSAAPPHSQPKGDTNVAPPPEPTAPSPVEEPPVEEKPPTARETIAWSDANAARIWRSIVAEVGGMAETYGTAFRGAAISAPNWLVVRLGEEYTLAKSVFERPDQMTKFEQAASRIVGQATKIRFELVEAEKRIAERPAPRRTAADVERELREITERPMVRQMTDLFGAEATDVAPPRDKKNA